MKYDFKHEIWCLLKKNISKGQLLGYAIANVVGLSVILSGILFYGDSQKSDTQNDKYFSDDYGLGANVSVIYANVQKAIDEEATAGRIERIDARRLFFSVVALNVFPFVSFEIYSRITGETNRESFLAERRAENIETMRRRILKTNVV